MVTYRIWEGWINNNQVHYVSIVIFIYILILNIYLEIESPI